MFYSHLAALGGGAIAGIVIGSLAFVVIIIALCLIPLKPYLTALFSGAFVPAFKLISLRFRKLNVMNIVESYVMAKKGKLNVSFNELEAHYLAGGSCKDCISALIKAGDAGVEINFKQAAAIDLATHDVLEAVNSIVNPRVHKISSIKGVAQDNFELDVSANISVKARLETLVGGLGLDTLESKVTKYIMTKISSLKDHKKATAYNITEDILKSGLDIKNGYQLISVDVVSINVSRDIGAELAFADLERVKAQAQIEAERQKNYVAMQAEQQKAKTQAMKTAVLEAEAEVPRAIAEAIRDGRFSVMDYYKLMNLQADTAMRRSLLGKGEEPKE